MYNLNLGTGESFQFKRPKPEGTSRYFLTFSEGFMYLHYNESDSLNSSATFKRSPPSGIVKESTGTLFLFDNEQGCVYTVLCFHQPDFVEEYEKNQQEMKYRAFGTPFETFFSCDESFQSDGDLDPERCTIGVVPSAEEIESECIEPNGGSSVQVLKYLLIIAALIAF